MDHVRKNLKGARCENRSRRRFKLLLSRYLFFESTHKKEDYTSEPQSNSKVHMKAYQADEALRHVRKRHRKGYVPRNNGLQWFPRLGWQQKNQLPSLYLTDNVVCRKFELLDCSLPDLQQIIPRSLAPDFLTSLHSTTTAGLMGTKKNLQGSSMLIRVLIRGSCEPLHSKLWCESKTFRSTENASPIFGWLEDRLLFSSP